MLSILKKSSDKLSASMSVAWHPNFRISEHLPDIKVVRTKFFINGLAVLITFSLAVYTIYREVEFSLLAIDIEAAKKIVETNRADSEKAVLLYKKFQEQQKKIQDLQQFLSISPLKVSEFLLKLGSSLPPLFNLSSFDYNATGVTIRGRINASSEQGVGLASRYVDQLKANEYIKSLFDSIILSDLVRDSKSDEINFKIDFKFKSNGKPINGNKK